MIEIHTLENAGLKKIAAVFNESFSDYIVPLKLNEEQLENKIKNDSIQLAFSTGAFEQDNLVGFILHGYDIVNNEKVIYNAGTGVIPSRRGQRLTRSMYDHILPVLRSAGISKIQLEVITGNKPAIATYQQLGFKTARELNCYKGAVSIAPTNNNFSIEALGQYDWKILQSFWDWQPSWQNAVTAVENLAHSNASFGIYSNEILLGYIIFNPLSKRVQQFAVHKDHPGIGIGKQLFLHLAQTYRPEISIINVDERSKETAEFMRSIGLESYVIQFEMEMKLN